MGIYSDYYVESDAFFVEDAACGWRNGEGVWEQSAVSGDSTIPFQMVISADGSRKMAADTNRMDESAKRIFVYGCTFTLGKDLPDTSTAWYKLQQRLPGWQVANKGASGYGLTQMFCALRQSVERGDTPDIAVFNYATFHDMRTPLSKQWSSSLCWGNAAVRNGEGYFPYYEYEHDTLVFKKFPFRNLTRNWPLADKSSVMYLLNRTWFEYYDDHIRAPYFHLLAQKTALEIMRYCSEHHITGIITNISYHHPLLLKIPEDVTDTAAAHGYYALNYGVDIGDSVYNGTPFDAGQPNARAHRVFANKLYNFMMDNHLCETR